MQTLTNIIIHKNHSTVIIDLTPIPIKKPYSSQLPSFLHSLTDNYIIHHHKTQHTPTTQKR